MIRYGKKFPDNVSDASVELYCYRYHNPNNAAMLPKHEHFINAIKLLWPERYDDGTPGYIWSQWSYVRAKAWCDHNYQTWWGPAASGKSTDAAIFALTHWLSAPTKTTIIVCSTSMTDLKQRIWREIVRLWSLLKAMDVTVPGVKKEMPPTITYEPQIGEAINTVNALFGIPIPRGTAEDAVKSALGKHNEYVCLIVDEMQLMHPAVEEGFDNVSAGNREAKFLGMGNPVSRLDSLGKASTPKIGWDSITTENESWETKKGMCFFFDGLKSPGVEDPERYFFLLTQKQIDQMIKDPGPDSPRFWTQRRGFCPPEGLTQTVMSETFVNQYGLKDSIHWIEKPKPIGGIDPAFSSGGDKAVFVLGLYGKAANRLTCLLCKDPINIPLELSANETMTDKLAGSIIKIMVTNAMCPSDITLDTTGAQSMLADVIDQKWLKMCDENSALKPGRCNRLSFGGKPSDLPFTTTDPTPCKDKFDRKVSELWYMARIFGMSDQLKGLSEQAVQEFCTRLTTDRGTKIVLEPKKDMKERTGGLSPDTGDATVCLVDHFRKVCGITPEQNLSEIRRKKINRVVHSMLDDVDNAYPDENSLYTVDAF